MKKSFLVAVSSLTMILFAEDSSIQKIENAQLLTGELLKHDVKVKYDVFDPFVMETEKKEKKKSISEAVSELKDKKKTTEVVKHIKEKIPTKIVQAENRKYKKTDINVRLLQILNKEALILFESVKRWYRVGDKIRNYKIEKIGNNFVKLDDTKNPKIITTESNLDNLKIKVSK